MSAWNSGADMNYTHLREEVEMLLLNDGCFKNMQRLNIVG